MGSRAGRAIRLKSGPDEEKAGPPSGRGQQILEANPAASAALEQSTSTKLRSDHRRQLGPIFRERASPMIFRVEPRRARSCPDRERPFWTIPGRESLKGMHSVGFRMRELSEQNSNGLPYARCHVHREMLPIIRIQKAIVLFFVESRS
jgi:hypothetical protein